MPTLVFPAPGAPYARRLTASFSGFDMSPVTNTTIRNLLLDSNTFVGSNWTVGPYSIPFNTVTDYISDSILQSNVNVTSSGLQALITAISNTQRIGQRVAVIPNTTYTFSFYARRGTATDNFYKVLDFSRNTDLVNPTSYYSQLNGSTLTRVTTTFTTSLNTRFVVLYPVWDISSGYGTSYIADAQFELGTSATAYQATYGTANSAAGITVNRVVGTIRPRNNIRGVDRRGATTNLITKFTVKSNRSQIFYTPLTGKVLPRNNIKGIVDNRSVSKVLPRNNIKGVDRRGATTNLITKFTVKSNRSHVFYTPYIGVIPAAPWYNNIRGVVDNRSVSKVLPSSNIKGVTLTANFFRLESFDNQGIYLGDTFNITGQNNIRNNSVNQHIYDLDVLSVTVSANGAQQTLYFNSNPNGYNSVNYFPVGFYVRITDFIGNTSYIVQVTASTTSSITFNTISGFPNRIGGTGLTVQSATSFVYPKSTVDSNMYSYISANGINLYNYPTNPRENLSVSEFKLNFRPATTLSIENNSFKDTLPFVYPTIGNMSTFDAGVIPGDFKITTTGQSADTVNNAVIWYRNELDVLTVTSSVSGLKTAFFPVQDAVPYPSGSQVRLVNTSASFNQIVTVITGTSSSISFNGTMPIGATTIERVVSSVYPQQYVSTTTAPTTPRENLFYSTLAVGYRSNSSITQGTLFAADGNVLNTLKLNTASVLRSVVTVPTSNNLEKPVTSLRSTRNLPTVSKLSSAIIVQSDRASFAVHRVNDLYQQSSVVVRGAPTNPRENLYYFILAPGYRANSSIVQGKLFVTGDQPLPINNLNKQLAVLKTDRATLSVSKLQAAQVLKTDRTRIDASLIAKFTVKSNTTQVFYTPRTDKLSQASVVRSDRTTISANSLNKQIFILKPDQTRLLANDLTKQIFVLKTDRASFSVNKLSSVAVLRTDTTKLNADKLDLFKVRFDTTEVFETPRSDNLERQLARLTSGDIDFAIEKVSKLSSAITVKADKTVLTSNSLQKEILSLEYNDIIKYSLLDRFIVKSNATQVFGVPASDSLRNGLVVRDLGIMPSTALLVNKGFVVKAESATFKLTLLEKPLVPIGYNDIVKYSLLDRFIVKSNATQVFGVPNTDSLRNGFVVRDLRIMPSTAILVNKGFVVRAESATFKLTLLDKFKIPATNTKVFYQPQIGKLSAAVVVRQSNETARIGRLIAAVKVIAETNRFTVYSTDNYANQFIYNNLNPNNSAISKFQYFNIAPGFRYNSSIQQGLTYEPSAAKVRLESLATFNNVGLTTDPYISSIFTTDPTFSVTGRTSNVTTNAVLLYINDLDILTVTPVGTPTVTLYFYARDQLPVPIPTSAQIVINHVSSVTGIIYTRTVSVIGSSAGSVTIVDPGDLPSISGMTIARIGIGYSATVYFSTRINPPYPVNSYITLTNNQNSTRATERVVDCGLNYVTYVKSVNQFWLPEFDNATIASASVSIIPKSTVSTNVAPTTPREYLYYAELARGYKYGVLNTVFGSSLSDESPANIKTQFLEKDYYRLKGLRSPDTVRNLERQLFKLVQPNKRSLAIEFLNPVKFKDFKHQVFYVDPGGRIIRFKTGDFKQGSRGIVDVAAPKKEPIQFWN